MRSTAAHIAPDWVALGWQENGEHRVIVADEVRQASMSAEVEDPPMTGSAGGVLSVGPSHVTKHILEVELGGTYTIAAGATWRTAADNAGMNHIVGAMGISVEALEILYRLGAEHAETKEEVAALEMVAEYLGH